MPQGWADVEVDLDAQSTVTSLAFNPLVYSKSKSMLNSVSDGLSSTIAIAEHYGFCEGARFDWRQVENACYDFPSMQPIPCPSSSLRRSTFADWPMFADVTPVTTEVNGRSVTTGSVPMTFQVQPLPDQCDPRILQSSLPGGIACGFADGSVRFVGQGVSDAVFWGSVTPDGGEAVSLD
jgi:hypothetical protein